MGDPATKDVQNKIINNLVAIDSSPFLHLQNTSTRVHCMRYIQPYCRTQTLWESFFPNCHLHLEPASSHSGCHAHPGGLQDQSKYYQPLNQYMPVNSFKAHFIPSLTHVQIHICATMPAYCRPARHRKKKTFFFVYHVCLRNSIFYVLSLFKYIYTCIHNVYIYADVKHAELVKCYLYFNLVILFFLFGITVKHVDPGFRIPAFSRCTKK